MTVTRRKALRTAAVFAAATHARPILGANDRVNLAIIGMGGRGRGHAEFYQQADNCTVAGICDVNQAARERASALVSNLQGEKPKEFDDMRRAFDDKDIDAVSVATPNHWHALTTIWACQAGKDVYVEKPASHNAFEGRQMVAAARQYNRMVQVGSQSRSIGHKLEAIQKLREGAIGTVYKARGLCFRRRKSIGHTPVEDVPPGLDWSYFLGPAPMRPYTKNRFAYNWHWFWDTGNGDIGNQGVHEMDICRWVLDEYGWPKSVSSTGGKYLWKGDQETPNTQQASYDWGTHQITFDVRNLSSPPEGSSPIEGNNYVGNVVFGDKGYMVLDPYGYRIYLGDKRELTEDVSPHEERIWTPVPHMNNFIEAVQKRDHNHLNADIAVGAAAADLVHLANISYRLGRRLYLDQQAGQVIQDDKANEMLTRDYRDPYVVPTLS